MIIHLYQIMELHWITLVVFLVGVKMVCLMRHHWVSNLDMLKDVFFPLIKASNLDLMMVNCFVLHFDLGIEIHLVLMKEPIWVVLVDDLILLMKALLRFH